MIKIQPEKKEKIKQEMARDPILYFLRKLVALRENNPYLYESLFCLSGYPLKSYRDLVVLTKELPEKIRIRIKCALVYLDLLGMIGKEDSNFVRVRKAIKDFVLMGDLGIKKEEIEKLKEESPEAQEIAELAVEEFGFSPDVIYKVLLLLKEMVEIEKSI